MCILVSENEWSFFLYQNKHIKRTDSWQKDSHKQVAALKMTHVVNDLFLVRYFPWNSRMARHKFDLYLLNNAIIMHQILSADTDGYVFELVLQKQFKVWLTLAFRNQCHGIHIFLWWPKWSRLELPAWNLLQRQVFRKAFNCYIVRLPRIYLSANNSC